jgi:probable F420-dependent oxidoreductase
MEADTTAETTRRNLGRYGVWIAPITLVRTPMPVLREQLARIEGLGYGSLWTGEPPAAAPGGARDPFALSAVMLAATRRLVVGVGIANIGMRVPAAMHGAAATVAEAYPDRFVLGLGGHSGERPLTQLREYLEAMDEAADRVLPGVRYPLVLGALGPKAHTLAAERADGVHPFLQPLEHTERARKALGPGPLLLPHQAVVLETDPDGARGRLRAALGLTGGPDAPIAESPYTRHYRRLGYADADLAGARSDRLVDAVLAWGDEDAVVQRIEAHRAAGADHVLVHPIAADLPGTVDQLARLAPALGPRP